MLSAKPRKSIRGQFTHFLKSNGYSERTIDTYLFHIEKLSERYSIDNLRYKDIVLAISDPEFSLRYRQVIVAALKQYYHFLMWKGSRDSHPCPNLRIRSNYSKNFLQQDFLSADELQLLRSREQRYRLLDLRDKVLLSFMTIQGLSPAELQKIDIDHVNLNTQKILVAGSRKYKKRALNLLKDQADLISDYLNDSRPYLVKSGTRSLILGLSGERISTDSIHYLISTLKDIVPDKKITPSMIRQSVICWWINDLKIPLEQAQLMSGHRWISSTQKYEFRKVEDDLALVNRWQ